MNSVYATVIISEWPVCEPAPVGGARLLSWPLVACRGALVAGGPAGGGRGPGETLARSAPYPARLQLGLCWLPATPLDAGFCCAGQGARHQRPRRGASKKRRQQKTPRPGAEKKSPPPSFVLLVALSHRKTILSSVVATSTFYARTQVRSRLRTQLFEKVAKNEKVVKSQQ